MSDQPLLSAYVPDPSLLPITQIADPILRILFLLSEARYLLNALHEAKTLPESNSAMDAYHSFVQVKWFPPECSFPAEIQATLSRPAIAHLIENGVPHDRAEQAVLSAIDNIMILMGIGRIAPAVRWYELYGNQEGVYKRWNEAGEGIHFTAGVEKELGDVAALGKLLYPPMRYNPPSPYAERVLLAASRSESASTTKPKVHPEPVKADSKVTAITVPLPPELEVRRLLVVATAGYAASNSDHVILASPVSQANRGTDEQAGQIVDGILLWPFRSIQAIGGIGIDNLGRFTFLHVGSGNELKPYYDFSCDAGAALLACSPSWFPKNNTPVAPALLWTVTLAFLSPTTGKTTVVRDNGLRIIANPWAASIAALNDILQPPTSNSGMAHEYPTETQGRNATRDAEVIRLKKEKPNLSAGQIANLIRQNPDWAIMGSGKPLDDRAVRSILSRARKPKKAD